MQLFYCPGIPDQEYFLNEEESRHCHKVLRMEAGDELQLTDGCGNFYLARITDISAKRCQFEILKKEEKSPPFHHIHIAIAPTKNTDRMEWFIEKAVEIGVQEISFLRTEHSERKNLNLNRIQKKAISAMKQSVRPFLPKINALVPFNSFLQTDFVGERFVAHLGKIPADYLHQKATADARYTILIGPEGGFTDLELSELRKRQFQPVKLGDARLRTETAGVVACSILNTLNLS